MTTVTIAGSTLEVDAATVAAGLRMNPLALRSAMHDGTVTSLSETGEGEDAGRFRITFFSATRRMRLTVDATGTVLQHSTADYSRKPAQPVLAK